MRSKWLLMTSLVLALSACDNNPGEGKPTATVSDPAPAVAPAEPGAAAPTAAPANSVNYTFSSADSKIGFVGAKVTGKHDGGFKTFTGSITVPDGKVELGSVKVEIDTTSLFADDPKLEKHLKSEDFFAVEKFPKAEFTSTAVAPTTEAGKTHTITGNLQLHGVTKTISFPASVRVQGDAVETDAEFVINRKDFDITYKGMPDDLIKDEVLLKLEIRAKKAAST